VIWSNENPSVKRFGFKVHTDGADPLTWSADEVPASQSALDLGTGMGDDHMNMAVGSDGTIYAAVKTSYDTPGNAKMAMLVRHPWGAWDDLYYIDDAGTRPVAMLNESEQTITVVYTSAEGFNNIVYRRSALHPISFGPKQTLMSSGYNNVSTMKQTDVNDVVFIASSATSAVSVLTATANIALTPPALLSPANAVTLVPVTPTLSWNASTGADTYRVQVSTASNFLTTVFDQSGLAATSVAVTPALSNSSVYYWRVNATNTGGTSEWSTVWSFTTIESLAPIEDNGAGYVLDFDGTDDYVNCGNNSSVQIAGTAITMEAWIKPTKAAGTMSIIKKTGIIGGGTGYELYCGSAGWVYCRFNGLDASRAWSTTPYPTDGTWLHVAATYDGVSTKIYVNGVQEASTAYTAPIVNSANPLYIANDPSTTAKLFQGSVDEVRLWNIVRSEADIKATMTRKLMGNESGLVGYWRFDEVSGTTMKDETSNQNYGSMTGMDPATDHIWSGAALGDASAYDYLSAGGYSATLSHVNGDALTATTTSGTITGLQVYRADDNAMRTGSTGLAGYSLDPSRFWGVRAIGTATPTYTLVYNYSGNPSIVTEAGLKLVKRNAINVAAWTDASATLDMTANTLTVTGATGTEYALAIPPSYTLTYTAGANGAISGTSPQMVSAGESGTAVTAVPNTGYHFVNWSDASTANPRTDASVTGNISVTATFAINTYTLTYTAGSNGTITGTSPQTVNHGASGTAVTAVPNTGYHFVNWSDASTTNPRTDAGVTGNISVTATFAINTYTLTYSADPNGSITGTSPQTVNYGTSGTAVTAVPNTGYHFVNWSDASTTNPRTDAGVTGNISVTANFAINTYTLTYSADPNGSISGTTPQTVNHGASGTAVTAVPNTGYHFVNWSDASTTNPRTDAGVTGNISVTANFAINTYTLTYTADPNGSITGTSPQTVNHGASGTAVTAVPNTGYHFVNWSDASTTNPRTDAGVTGNISVTATFAINTYTLTYSADPNGAITGTSPQTVNYGASGTAVTAVPNAGYHFVNWSDASTANPRTDAGVTGNISVTATFAINTYTLTYTAGSNGSISGTSPQTVDYGANGTAVTAVPNTGYHFVNWSDASTANPRTDVNVTGDFTVTATFAINTYTLTYTAGSNGSISGTSPQTVDHGTNGTAVTAVPNTGYHFVNWSDASTANPRTDVNVTVDITVTATFALNIYTIQANAGPHGSISPSGAVSVNHGADQTFIIAPDGGYNVVDVLVDGISVGAVTSHTFTNIVKDHTISASFTAGTHTITATAGPNGSISPSGSVFVANGADQSFTITPNAGYHVASLTVDGTPVTPVIPGGMSHTFTNVTTNHTIAATFAINTYTLTYAAGANGTITGTSPQTVNYGGSGTAVTAVPNAGYHFVNWSDASTANPRTDVGVTGNISVTATFAINTYTLTYTAGSNGSISGTSPQTVNYGGSGTAVTAVPNTGYHFVNWSDASTANPRTDIGVSGNISVIANFAKDAGCCVNLTGNVDCDPADGTDISDLTALIDNLYIAFTPLCCKEEANIDGSLDGNADISDLTALIDYMYISFTLPAACR
jgi:hypothetical protein